MMAAVLLLFPSGFTFVFLAALRLRFVLLPLFVRFIRLIVNVLTRLIDKDVLITLSATPKQQTRPYFINPDLSRRGSNYPECTGSH